jgi:GTP pyrophosphokinase
VVEDTPTTIQDIERLFNPGCPTRWRINQNIDGSKGFKRFITSRKFQKNDLTLNDDVRVILIKLADRLHNMQTMESMGRQAN